MSKSFYDLDYLIETGEKRLEQYTSFYYKVSERITHILLIYSAFSIFLVQLAQHIMNWDIFGVPFYISVLVFGICFITSVIYFVRLLIPIHVAYLDPPAKYVYELKRQTEEMYPDQEQRTDNLLKTSYLIEIYSAIDNNCELFKRKNSFYQVSLLFALIATIPYIICLGYHLSQKSHSI